MCLGIVQRCHATFLVLMQTTAFLCFHVSTLSAGLEGVIAIEYNFALDAPSASVLSTSSQHSRQLLTPLRDLLL